MDVYWNKFITGYCKVEFLCYRGEPNWLGWIPIGLILGLIALALIYTLLCALWDILDQFLYWLDPKLKKIEDVFLKKKKE